MRPSWNLSANKRCATISPACGSSNSAIELTMQELDEYSSFGGWVDVCKLPQEDYGDGNK